MGKGSALIILAGFALWAYSRGSSAALSPTSPASSDAGPPWADLFGSSAPAADASATQAAPDNAGVSPDATSSGFFDLGAAYRTPIASFSNRAYVTDPSQIDISAPWKTGSYPQYAMLITNTEIRCGIPTDLLARLLYEESRFRPDIIDCRVRSATGASGIAQFEPATASDYAIDPCDPTQAIPAAGKYLAALYVQFGSWTFALMAYNWGPGNVKKYVASGGSLPVPSETQDYVSQITADVQVA